MEESDYLSMPKRPVIVKIKNNRLDTAFYSDSTWQRECREIVATPFLVDSIFQWLLEGVQMPAAHYGAKFDSVTGIPVYGYIDENDDTVDDEISFSLNLFAKK